jgi:hypothetical protein
MQPQPLGSSGQRAVDAGLHDLQTELKRTNDQPPDPAASACHRAGRDRWPEESAEWNWTALTVMNGKAQRDFCQQTHTLKCRAASAKQADALGVRAAELQRKIEHNGGGDGSRSAAAVLLALVKKLAPSATMEDIQTAMSVFAALLPRSDPASACTSHSVNGVSRLRGSRSAMSAS